MEGVSKRVADLFYESLEAIKSRLRDGDLKVVILEGAHSLECAFFTGELERDVEVTYLNVPETSVDGGRVGSFIRWEAGNLHPMNGKPALLFVNSRGQIDGLPDDVRGYTYSIRVSAFRRQADHGSSQFYK
ncbi:MAG: hypothetical protein AABW87_02390 [Nanoarchaeota archaeon]